MPYVSQHVKAVGSPYSRRKRNQGRPAVPRGLAHHALPLNPSAPIRRVLFILFGLCSALILLIWLQIQIHTISGNVTDLEQKIHDQESINQYAIRELDKATSYEFIYPLVKSRFGMDLPSMPKVLLPVPEEVLSQKNQNRNLSGIRP